MSTVVDPNQSAAKQDTITVPGADAIAPVRNGAARLDRIFDAMSERDWCELIRDVAAVANSGGGEIVLRSSASEQPGIDTNNIRQRLAEFTDSGFADIRVRAGEPAEAQAAVVAIGRAPFPIVFTNSGSYSKTAGSSSRIEVFARGSVYFWNGTNSEPATSRSLQAFVERVRRRWLAGIRRVLKQPVASLIAVKDARSGKRKSSAAQANLQPVRIVTDPNAPALQPQDVDRLYPLRQKDLVIELNRRLGRRAMNSYDIQAVRRQHRLDERPDFVFHLPGAGRRYSPAVMEWMMEQMERDADFLRKARAADTEMLKLRRQKPR